MEPKGSPHANAMRILMWSVPILALLCIAGIAMVAHATLIDNETPPNPPQYYDWDHAYPISAIELNNNITVRRDGGNDDDYLKLPFLAINDVVTVDVYQREGDENNRWPASVDYWVSDPNHFPIYYNQFRYNGPPDDPHFQFQFAAIISGAYFIHTGQGFGDTWINFNISRTPSTPPAGQKDTNNKPSENILLAADTPHRENIGQIWDPSDFFRINIQPTADLNKYISVRLDNATGMTVVWEVYSSTGIQRLQKTYSSDFLQGIPSENNKRDKAHPLIDMPITTAGDYYIRIWGMAGYGWFELTLSTLTYPNDHNNSIPEAYLVRDNTFLTADVNLSFDPDDYNKIYLGAKDPLYVTMKPDNGPADLFLLDADGNQKGISNNPGLEGERIGNWLPPEAGWYYILVSAMYEDAYPYPPTVTYSLTVWINSAPTRNSTAPPRISVYEDTVNTTFSVVTWFKDADGDPLTFSLDMSYNNTLIDIELLADNHLRIAPKANASGFEIPIVVNATDPYGLMVNHTVRITVIPVNDPPYVDLTQVPDEIRIGEDLVKGGVNVTRAFRDVDDSYVTWRFKATSTPHVKVELDPLTWLATFTPLVPNWFGTDYFNVTCTDSGGLNATIMFKIVVYEINDPPYISHYITQIQMMEEGTYTIDLVNNESGPFFLDVEGKPLTYAFGNNGSVTVSIVNGVLTFVGQKFFSGIITGMQLWAIDDLGAKSPNMTLLITVNPYDNAPTLTALKTSVTVQEGQSVKFESDVYYQLFDPDSQPIDETWQWFVNGVEVPSSQIADRFAFEYFVPITAEKDRDVTVMLKVSGVNPPPAYINWTVHVTNKNMPPSGVTVTATPPPPDYKQGTKITFTANATDMDNDTLTYSWFLDETTAIGTGPTISYKDFTVTGHKVTVKVSDGQGGETTSTLDINVKKKSGGTTPGFEGYAIVAAMALVVVALVALRRRY